MVKPTPSHKVGICEPPPQNSAPFTDPELGKQTNYRVAEAPQIDFQTLVLSLKAVWTIWFVSISVQLILAAFVASSLHTTLFISVNKLGILGFKVKICH